MKNLIIVVLAILIGACSQIDTGNVGVEKTLGQVKPEIMPPGVYFTLFKSVTEVCAKELPLQLNDLRPQTNDKITLADLDVDIYIQLDPSKASTVMTKWPGDISEIKEEDCTRVGMNYVTRQAREAIYNAASQYGSATIHTERNQIASSIVKSLQIDLDNSAGAGLFFVRSTNVRSLMTDPALEKNIMMAAQAQFKLQEEKNRLEVAKVEADRKRAEAQGDADAIKIKADF